MCISMIPASIRAFRRDPLFLTASRRQSIFYDALEERKKQNGKAVITV